MSERTKVDIVALAVRAEDVHAIQKEITSIMAEIMAKVTSLNNTWESPEAQTYQSRFSKTQRDIEAVLRMITIRANNIIRAAEAYNVAFREVSVNIDELPGSSSVPPLVQ
jgi:uncharacterized protein YukE